MYVKIADRVLVAASFISNYHKQLESWIWNIVLDDMSDQSLILPHDMIFLKHCTIQHAIFDTLHHTTFIKPSCDEVESRPAI